LDFAHGDGKMQAPAVLAASLKHQDESAAAADYRASASGADRAAAEDGSARPGDQGNF